MTAIHEKGAETMGNRHDFTLLRNRINDLYGNERAFSKAIQWKPQRLESRLTNETEFTRSEIIQILPLVGIDWHDVKAYFF